MKLGADYDMVEFMKAVHKCTGDVYFVSGEGDRLNLKSALSQFLFAMLQTDGGKLQGGDIVCCEEDSAILRPFTQNRYSCS